MYCGVFAAAAVVTTSGDLPVDGAEEEEEEEEIKKVPLELLEQVSTTAVISDAQDEDIANLDATGLRLLDTHELEQAIDEEMPTGSATPDEDVNLSTPETLAEPGTAESLCIVDASIDPVTPSPVELVTPDIDTPVELVTPDIDTLVELATLVEQLPADTNETATAESSASEKTNLLKAVVGSESRSSGESVVSSDAVSPNTTQRVREETDV